MLAKVINRTSSLKPLQFTTQVPSSCARDLRSAGQEGARSKVTADKKEYLPGEKAKLNIEVKDLSGKPVAGNVLVSVYDRSLEQIAGDVLPSDIREFFWKWRRNYYR